jgi:hypothetical protein
MMAMEYESVSVLGNVCLNDVTLVDIIMRCGCIVDIASTSQKNAHSFVDLWQ